MGSNYKCGQFDDAFKPNRLCNWCCPCPKRCPPECSDPNGGYLVRRSQFYKILNHQPWAVPAYLTGICHCRVHRPTPAITKFIVDDRGYLLDRYRPARMDDEEYCIEVEPWMCADCAMEIKMKNACCKPKPWTVLPTFYKKDKDNQKLLSAEDHVDIAIDKLTNELRKRKFQLPIIWIFGCPQLLSTRKIRKKYAQNLAKRLNFKYLDMDAQLANWICHRNIPTALTFAACDSNRDPRKSIPKMFDSKKYLDAVRQRAISMAHRLDKRSEEKLNVDGLMEVIKFAMIQNYPTSGFVLMNFPHSLAEASAFEYEFWPVTTGIYFQDSQWSSSQDQTPLLRTDQRFQPKLFRRPDPPPYAEINVESCCDAYGFKTIKVRNAEWIGEKEIGQIDKLVDMFLVAMPNILHGQQFGLLPIAEESWDRRHPIIIEGQIPSSSTAASNHEPTFINAKTKRATRAIVQDRNTQDDHENENDQEGATDGDDESDTAEDDDDDDDDTDQSEDNDDSEEDDDEPEETKPEEKKEFDQIQRKK